MSTFRRRARSSTLMIGANQGARGNLSAVEKFNALTRAAAPEVVYADVVPGRAHETAELARTRGIDARAIEARGEDVLADSGATALVAHVDNAATLATLVRASQVQELPLLGLLIAQLPNNRLAAMFLSLRPNDERAESIAGFFGALDSVAARSGSRAIFGEGARPLNALLQPSFRRAFQEHSAVELARVVAGVPAEREAAEIMIGGGRPMPLLIAERPTFGEPVEVVGEVVEQGRTALQRGQRFTTAEVTPEGIRLHEGRLRLTDGTLDVRPVSTVTPATLASFRAAERAPEPFDTKAFIANLAGLAAGLVPLLRREAEVAQAREVAITTSRAVLVTD